MAATPTFCPQCGTPLQGASRFCTNCGATIETHANTPTIAATPNSVTLPANTGPGTPPASTPPPPPATQTGRPMYTSQSNPSLPPPPPPPVYNPYTTNASSGTPSYAQNTSSQTYTPSPAGTPPPQAGGYQVPDYAKKPGRRTGCVTASIVLLLVLVVGIGGYVLLTRTIFNQNSQQTGASTPTSGPTTTSTTPGSTTSSSSGSGSLVPLNLQFIYSGVNITILSAQIAHSFADDPTTTAGSAGIVRITLRENNTSSHNPNYLESDSTLLMLPGGTTVQLGDSQAPISPDAGVNRQNWLDFPLNTPVTVDQMTLRIGTQSQSQFAIPLRANADLSKYQDKTSTPGTQFKYGPLNMTLKSATLSYSYNGEQATAGNRYVILTLGALNNSTDDVDIYPSSYMRLQAGGNSAAPDYQATIPYSVKGNTSVSGIVAFLVPQDATSFTFVMLAQSSATPPINQVTQTFQVQ